MWRERGRTKMGGNQNLKLGQVGQDPQRVKLHNRMSISESVADRTALECLASDATSGSSSISESESDSSKSSRAPVFFSSSSTLMREAPLFVEVAVEAAAMSSSRGIRACQIAINQVRSKQAPVSSTT